MKHFKTPKGTELPLMDIKGKDYLQVAHRLVWFREDHPDWTILTDYVELGQDHAICRATIKAGETMVSTGHKYEDKKGFSDFIEKAETGSIGRALAHCGYGTQFAPELEEGERLADAPVSRPPIPSNGARPTASASPDSVHAQKEVSFDRITDKQQKRLFAIARECNWGKDDVKGYLSKLGLEHSDDLNWMQYETLIKNIQTFHKN